MGTRHKPACCSPAHEVLGNRAGGVPLHSQITHVLNRAQPPRSGLKVRAPLSAPGPPRAAPAQVCHTAFRWLEALSSREELTTL